MFEVIRGKLIIFIFEFWLKWVKNGLNLFVFIRNVNIGE